MIYTLIILLFLIYNITLFITNNIYLLITSLVINIILFILSRINIKKYMQFLIKNLLFIIFIFLGNLLFSTFYLAFLTSFKLFLVINLTYLISIKISISNLAQGFNYLLWPLKIFKVDINSLTLTITIALSFIPILIDEAKSIRISLKNKGFNFNLKNVITRPHLFVVTYLNNLFNRIEEIENALKMKGFE